ncbi:hypothetical protein J7E87_17885 [Streptomyces sp. ISL-1]|nr:hypothetical protein [Streptomyces sp. ISL-1]
MTGSPDLRAAADEGGVLEEFRRDVNAGQVLGEGKCCFCGQVLCGVGDLVPELEAAVARP